MTFEEFKNNKNLKHFFIPLKDNLSYGKGFIRLIDNRIYEGDIYFDGTNYFPFGRGKLDFHDTWGNFLDPHINERISYFKGEFDYRVVGSIYGNGVMYFEDENHQSTHFLKGFFREYFKIGEYQLENVEIDPPYRKEDEFFYNRSFYLVEKEVKDKKKKKYHALFIGDSYFEGYKNFNFYDEFPNSLNLGISGWTFLDYLNTINSLIHIYKDIKSDYVIVNLGFNDINFNFTLKEVMSNFKNFHSLLNDLFSTSKIVYLTVIKAPLYKEYDKDREIFYDLFTQYLIENNIEFIDMYKIFSSLSSEEINSYFQDDLAHPNKKGYSLYTKAIKDILD